MIRLLVRLAVLPVRIGALALRVAVAPVKLLFGRRWLRGPRLRRMARIR